MAESGEGGDAGGVDEVAEVGEDVDVCSERPNLGVWCKWIFSFWERVVSCIERAVVNDSMFLTFCPAIRQSDSVESA